ncbi:MAG TPA: lysophospholipid acyltransferase family protein [Dehalococcoidia bacterium]|nr:lysophospholipid acyltransferase family protein [Dehalococcoidia bacterium]
MALTTRHSRWLPGPWLYVFNRSGIPLVSLDLAYRFAVPIAYFFYHLLNGRRQTVRRNYARILGRSLDDPLVGRMTRACFLEFGRYVAEFAHVQSWDNETFHDRVEIVGEEHLDEAESLGRGVIFTSAHMGSTEVAAALVVLRGARITSVTERIRPQFFMDWAIASRADRGITLMYPSGAGIKLLRALRRKELVALVVDAGIDQGGGVPVAFFGHQTTFPVGPARVARLSGAPIVFGLAVRLPHGRFRVHICPPLSSDRDLDPDEDARQLTQAIADLFEGFVRRYPAQWYVFRDMWPGGGWELNG